MTTTPGHAGGEQQLPRGPEPDRVKVRAIHLFAALLAFLLIVIQPFVGRLLRVYRGDRPEERLTSESVDLGTARHWNNPTADLAATRAREDRQLNHYAWIDRESGVVRIPLERAMELIVQRGAAAETRHAP